MNRIMELHAAATNLILLAQAELQTIAHISQGEGDQYDKDMLIKEHKIKMQKLVRSYLRTIRTIEQIIKGEII